MTQEEIKIEDYEILVKAARAIKKRTDDDFTCERLLEYALLFKEPEKFISRELDVITVGGGTLLKILSKQDGAQITISFKSAQFLAKVLQNYVNENTI